MLAIVSLMVIWNLPYVQSGVKHKVLAEAWRLHSLFKILIVKQGTAEHKYGKVEHGYWWKLAKAECGYQ